MSHISDPNYAQELLKAETGDIRSLGKYENFLIACLAIGWAVFQLALAGFLVLDSTKVRAIHLAFALALIFLLDPCIKHPKKHFKFLAVTDRIPVIDYLLAILAVAGSRNNTLPANRLPVRYGPYFWFETS